MGKVIDRIRSQAAKAAFRRHEECRREHERLMWEAMATRPIPASIFSPQETKDFWSTIYGLAGPLKRGK
jgi:hypothetical protein